MAPRLRLGNLANFAKTLQKGQLVSLEGKIKYRTVEEDVKGKPVKHTIAEIHASSIRRLSKVEAATIRPTARTKSSFFIRKRKGGEYPPFTPCSPQAGRIPADGCKPDDNARSETLSARRVRRVPRENINKLHWPPRRLALTQIA